MINSCMKLYNFLEKLDKDSDMGDYIKDFYKSDAPQFKGKSKKKRRQMAIVAKLNADESISVDVSEDDEMGGGEKLGRLIGRLKHIGLTTVAATAFIKHIQYGLKNPDSPEGQSLKSIGKGLITPSEMIGTYATLGVFGVGTVQLYKMQRWLLENFGGLIGKIFDIPSKIRKKVSAGVSEDLESGEIECPDCLGSGLDLNDPSQFCDTCDGDMYIDASTVQNNIGMSTTPPPNIQPQGVTANTYLDMIDELYDAYIVTRKKSMVQLPDLLDQYIDLKIGQGRMSQEDRLTLPERNFYIKKFTDSLRNMNQMQQLAGLSTESKIIEDLDINDGMIGVPDTYYSEEERREAYNDLQDALQGNYMDDYIIDGACPACGGTGYMDGEDEVYNDETDEYEEGTECDGFGRFGCDQGEMTYGSDGPSWVEIIQHDERTAEREKSRTNYPGDEEVIKQIAKMVKNMDDPRMVYQYVQADYPFMGRAQRSNLIAKGMQQAGLTAKESINMNEEYSNENELEVAKILGKALDKKQWYDYSPQELFSELESVNVDLADTINKLAKVMYGVRLQEDKNINEAVPLAAAVPYVMSALGTAARFAGKMLLKRPVTSTVVADVAFNDADLTKAGAEAVLDLGLEALPDAETFKDRIVDFVKNNPGATAIGFMLLFGGPIIYKKLKAKLNLSDEDDKKIKMIKDKTKQASQQKMASNESTEVSFDDDDAFFEEFGWIDGDSLEEAEYRGRKVKLNKPMQGDVKKFKVYVKDPKTGNVKKVNFGHGGSSVKGKAMKIRKNNPKARKSFRARHNCDNPGSKLKARYWSCRKW